MPTAVQCAGCRAPTRVGIALVADLLQVDDVGAVQHCEVHDKPRGTVQFTEQGPGGPHQAILVHGERAQLHQAHAELVVTAAAAQPAQLDQALEHPVRRRARQPGAPDDLGQREAPGAVECIQDERDAVDDRRGRGCFRGP